MFQIKQISQRGYFITFDEMVDSKYETTTNIYIIDSNSTIFICDTYLGPEVMEKVWQKLKLDKKKRKIVINSHYHWDHIWGNCFFSDADVIAHSSCLKKIERLGEEELSKLSAFQMGKVVIKLPTITFLRGISFESEGIYIFHSPGHTEDSISVFDLVDRVLFAADNVEFPIPSYIESEDINLFAETLDKYLKLNPKIIIPGHRQLLQKSDLVNNHKYLHDLCNDNYQKYESGIYRGNHLTNLAVINPSKLD